MHPCLNSGNDTLIAQRPDLLSGEPEDRGQDLIGVLPWLGSS